MTHQELLKTPEYWTAKIQIDLYNQVKKYIENKGINQTILAKELGVSKGYITQILSGDFDHRISKLVELSLAVGCLPQVSFTPINQCGNMDDITTQTIFELAHNANIKLMLAKHLKKEELKTPTPNNNIYDLTA